MKIPFLLVTLILFYSCTKQPLVAEWEVENKPVSARQLKHEQSTRISVWLLFDSSNYVEARADYIEFHLSDTLSNSITSADVVKVLGGIDKMAIQHIEPTFCKYLTKEYRVYPHVVADTIQLMTYSLTRGHYWIRIIANNVPPDVKIFLWDSYTGAKLQLPGGNISTWYWFKKWVINKRFKLIVS